MADIALLIRGGDYGPPSQRPVLRIGEEFFVAFGTAGRNRKISPARSHREFIVGGRARPVCHAPRSSRLSREFTQTTRRGRGDNVGPWERDEEAKDDGPRRLVRRICRVL